MSKRVGMAATVLVVALALFVAVANPASAQQGINDLWNAVLMHSTLRVQGAVTHDSTLTQTGAATFSSTATFADTLTASGALTVTGMAQGAVQTAAFTANGDGAAQTLTPTSNSIVVVPTGAVTLSVALGVNGRVIHIVNDTNANVLFPDSGNHLLGGARTLGQYDTLSLIQVGAKWHELATVAN